MEIPIQMFRKVTKKPKQLKKPRVLRDDDDDDDDEGHVDGPIIDDEDQASIHERIQQTQKKHKLLASLPIASGEDKPKKRRYLTTTSTLVEEENDETQDLTILAQKHKQAMDEYIQGQLTETPIGGNDSKSSNKASIDPELALYQELAATTVPSKVLVEDDAKGAMLVGGTGIAEVILPKNFEFDTNRNSSAGVRYSRNPNVSSAVANPRGVEAKNLLPAGFRSMVPEKIPVEVPPIQFSEAPTETMAQQAVVSTAVDDTRPGFAVLVSKAKRPFSNVTTQSSKPRGQHHEKDQQAFSKFVKRQRESGSKR